MTKISEAYIRGVQDLLSPRAAPLQNRSRTWWIVLHRGLGLVLVW